MADKFFESFPVTNQQHRKDKCKNIWHFAHKIGKRKMLMLFIEDGSMGNMKLIEL